MQPYTDTIQGPMSKNISKINPCIGPIWYYIMLMTPTPKFTYPQPTLVSPTPVPWTPGSWSRTRERKFLVSYSMKLEWWSNRTTCIRSITSSLNKHLRTNTMQGTKSKNIEHQSHVSDPYDTRSTWWSQPKMTHILDPLSYHPCSYRVPWLMIENTKEEKYCVSFHDTKVTKDQKPQCTIHNIEFEHASPHPYHVRSQVKGA